MIQELGLPLTSGPWYNASLELTHAGHIASCKLTFHGRQSSSDVLIRVCRCRPTCLSYFTNLPCKYVNFCVLVLSQWLEFWQALVACLLGFAVYRRSK